MVGKGDVRAIFGLPVTTDAGERLPPLTVETDFIHIYHQKFSSLLSKCVSIVLFLFVGGFPVLFHVFSENLIKSLYIVRVHLNFPLPVARGAIEDISTPSVPADPAAVGALSVGKY